MATVLIILMTAIDGDRDGDLGDKSGHVCPSTDWAGHKISNELREKGRGHLNVTLHCSLWKRYMKARLD